MRIILQLPMEINFGADDPTCYGLSGVAPSELNCITDRKKKTISFTNALEYAETNPGEIRLSIENLKNPSENKVTSSFSIKTETFDGYPMDDILTGISINFFCAFPCASCDNNLPTKCQSCYSTAVERYFYENKCLS
jgi:hypothetical protein